MCTVLPSIVAPPALKKTESRFAVSVSAQRSSEETEEPPTHLLLYLNDQTFVGDTGRHLAAAVRKLLADGHHDLGLSSTGHVKLLLVHELDEAKGGCEFSRFFDTTPRDLIINGVYKTLATGLAPGGITGEHRAVSIALIAKSMGARKQGKRRGAGSVMQSFETNKRQSALQVEPDRRRSMRRRSSFSVETRKKLERLRKKLNASQSSQSSNASQSSQSSQ